VQSGWADLSRLQKLSIDNRQGFWLCRELPECSSSIVYSNASYQHC